MINNIITYIILILGVFISLYPLYWLFVNATYESAETFTFPPHIFFGTHTLENLKTLTTNIHIARVILNSFFVSITATILTLIVSFCGGYAFAKFSFPLKKIIFGIFMISMMIPGQAIIITLTQVFYYLNLINSYTALIIPSICSIFVIFLIRQSLFSFPDELLDASRIDGADEMQILLKIVLPNSKPALATAGIIVFTGQWNSFLWPLIITNDPKMYTLPVALSTLKNLDHNDYGEINLGIAIATVPMLIIFLLLSKYFVNNVLASGTKN